VAGSGYQFFLSYASSDRDQSGSHKQADAVERFFADLTERLSQKAGVPIAEAGFAYHKNRLGAEWPPALVEALKSSQAMVCLYSPWYFKSEYCGKELAVFRDRVAQYALAKGLKAAPPLIFPVFLERDLTIPDPITDIVHDTADYPPQYLKLGVRDLLRSGAGTVHYNNLISLLARDIRAAVNAHVLPQSTALMNLDLVPSLFHGFEAAPPSDGAGIARLFFVVGTQPELQDLRTKVDSYGVTSALDWQPYYPPTHNLAVVLAQKIAARLNIVSLPEQVSASAADRFIDQLRAAHKNKNVVLVLVDPWTLRLDSYVNLMKHCDTNHENSAILVVMNKNDAETFEQLTTLDTRLNEAFSDLRLRNDPYVYREISSLVEFGPALEDVLAKVQLRTVQTSGSTKVAVGPPTISGAPV
jgi:FxsC-like protein